MNDKSLNRNLKCDGRLTILGPTNTDFPKFLDDLIWPFWAGLHDCMPTLAQTDRPIYESHREGLSSVYNGEFHGCAIVWYNECSRRQTTSLFLAFCLLSTYNWHSISLSNLVSNCSRERCRRVTQVICSRLISHEFNEFFRTMSSSEERAGTEQMAEPIDIILASQLQDDNNNLPKLRRQNFQGLLNRLPLSWSIEVRKTNQFGDCCLASQGFMIGT